MSHTTQFKHLKIQLEAIRSATKNFSDDNFLGRGGFGRVYKGKLVHSEGETMVALKRLDPEFGQGDSEFWKEITTLYFYRHENIVSLLGYCDDDGEKILVYEYAPNKSLDSYLAKEDLTWVQRLKICIGAARGLAYIHNPPKPLLRIFHRDIKSSNILLDNNWNAKISDFGLSKFAPTNSHFTFLVSNPTGTHGYIDPLYQETSLLTKESDVYSFGVVLFEVLCGRLSFMENLPPLVGLVREYYQHNRISDLIYSNIKSEILSSSLTLFVEIAYQCLRIERKERPSITEVVSALERALDIEEKADINKVGILNVKVLTADIRTSKKRFHASDYYMILYTDLFDPLQGKKTIVKSNKVLNGEWDEEVTLCVKDIHFDRLTIYIHKVESVHKHCHLGQAMMMLGEITPEISITQNLDVRDGINYEVIGDLKVEVCYKQLPYEHNRTNIEDAISPIQKAPIGTPKDGGFLVVIVHSADLYKRPLNHPAVSLLFRGELRTTRSMINTHRPMWLQEFTFMLERPPTDENLRLEVFNTYTSKLGLICKKESLGWLNISLADVVNEKQTLEARSLEPGFLLNDIHLHSRLFVEFHWRTSD